MGRHLQNNIMFNFFKKSQKIKPKSEIKDIKAPTQSQTNTDDFISSNGLLSTNKQTGKIEPYSPTWIYLDNYLNKRIETLRKMNDNISINHEKAQLLRGGIKELKLILNLSNEKKQNNNKALSQAYSQTITDYFSH